MSNLREIQLLLEKQKYKCGAIIGLAAFAFICSAIALGVSIYFASNVNNHTSPKYIYSDMNMPSSPYAFYLGKDSTVTVDLTISANDISNYIGKVYRVWSLSNKPHTITCGSGITFDGVNSKATFGTDIGDGIVFEVISTTRIAVISVSGVTLS
jgi:hypothetical protein